MRADRLVALLLLLQQRQRVTAAMVAEELESPNAPLAATSRRFVWLACPSTRSADEAEAGDFLEAAGPTYQG